MESIKNDKNKVNTKEEDELGELASGILEIMVDGYGFLRPKNCCTTKSWKNDITKRYCFICIKKLSKHQDIYLTY